MSANESGTPKGRYALYGAILVLSVIGVGIQWMMTRESGVTWTEAPPETRGVWTTDNARYAGRAIEVGPTSVTLLLGASAATGSVPGRLVIARELFENDVRVLRLEYETADGPDALDMVVEASGTMFLKNQPNVRWTSEGGPGFAPPPPIVTPVDEPGGMGPGTLGGLVLMLLVAGAGALWLFGNRTGSGSSSGERSPSGGTPKVVRGVWTTPDPRFAGQSIRIAHGYGFAQFGPGDIRVGGHIEGVDQWREDGARVFSIKYKTSAGSEEDLDLVINKSGHMRIRGGPKSLWVRRPE